MLQKTGLIIKNASTLLSNNNNK